jgi:hypothetical protein
LGMPGRSGRDRRARRFSGQLTVPPGRAWLSPNRVTPCPRKPRRGPARCWDGPKTARAGLRPAAA